MRNQSDKQVLLTDTLPAFADELRQFLVENGENRLAGQVSGLRMFDRCCRGDDFCATFYTQPKPEGSYGPDHRNVVLAPDDGTIILDVVDEKIACVEVLDRLDIREKLLTAIPWPSYRVSS